MNVSYIYWLQMWKLACIFTPAKFKGTWIPMDRYSLPYEVKQHKRVVVANQTVHILKGRKVS